ncbi:hypothetical protein PG987_003936 [Apiospora arundinis]
MTSGPLYIGFDLSTQQLKAIVVSSDLKVVSEAKVDFDADFGPKYGITKGVKTNEEEGEVFAPVAMWLEAVDLVLSRLVEKKCPVADIKGISGSCQQHGSVFWAAPGDPGLKALSKEKGSLHEQLKDAFAYEFGPNWQDHSTQAECDFYDQHLGSKQKLADVTGSSAHHRFTGTQIMRMRRRRPEVYQKTARISLVSSFLASVFLGAIAPMDISDVTGMNLWDIANAKWSDELLELCAGGKDGVPDLRKKLGDVRLDGGGSMGSISQYFVDKYGFSPDCQVVPFTGDNPATILALPLRPMDAIVSLGTPVHVHALLQDGGLAREKVRDKLPKPDGADSWANFNKSVLSTPPLDVRAEGDRAKLGLYFPLPEIVPNIKAGTWRYTSKAEDGSDLQKAQDDWKAETDARIIVESQALSMRLRSHNLLGSPPGSSLPAQPRRIYLVGGGSLNPAIARVLGDVLGGVDGVYKLDVGGNACALGGAYKAVWALERRTDRETFDELISERWHEAGAIQKVDDGYRDGIFQQYGNVVGAFEKMEQEILQVAHN